MAIIGYASTVMHDTFPAGHGNQANEEVKFDVLDTKAQPQ